MTKDLEEILKDNQRIIEETEKDRELLYKETGNEDEDLSAEYKRLAELDKEDE